MGATPLSACRATYMAVLEACCLFRLIWPADVVDGGSKTQVKDIFGFEMITQKQIYHSAN